MQLAPSLGSLSPIQGWRAVGGRRKGLDERERERGNKGKGLIAFYVLPSMAIQVYNNY
jgi:hypothetical protein